MSNSVSGTNDIRKRYGLPLVQKDQLPAPRDFGSFKFGNAQNSLRDGFLENLGKKDTQSPVKANDINKPGPAAMKQTSLGQYLSSGKKKETPEAVKEVSEAENKVEIEAANKQVARKTFRIDASDIDITINSLTKNDVGLAFIGGKTLSTLRKLNSAEANINFVIKDNEAAAALLQAKQGWLAPRSQQIKAKEEIRVPDQHQKPETAVTNVQLLVANTPSPLEPVPSPAQDGDQRVPEYQAVYVKANDVKIESSAGSVKSTQSSIRKFYPAKTDMLYDDTNKYYIGLEGYFEDPSKITTTEKQKVYFVRDLRIPDLEAYPFWLIEVFYNKEREMLVCCSEIELLDMNADGMQKR